MTSLIELIKNELGEAANLFPQGMDYPLLIQSAYKHEHCRTLGDLLCKAFQSKVIDPKIAEALVSMALYNCENKYCYIIHSYRLLGLGFSHADISDLIKKLQFPTSIPNKEKWDKILRLTFYAFKDRSLAIKNFGIIEESLTPVEYGHYADIISLSYLLEYLITVFHKEIDYSKERLFITESGELIPEINTFVKYTQKENDQVVPVFVICSYCKKIQSMVDKKWHNIEVIISEIPPESKFSHSMCTDCCEKQLDEMT